MKLDGATHRLIRVRLFLRAISRTRDQYSFPLLVISSEDQRNVTLSRSIPAARQICRRHQKYGKDSKVYFGAPQSYTFQPSGSC